MGHQLPYTVIISDDVHLLMQHNVVMTINCQAVESSLDSHDCGPMMTV